MYAFFFSISKEEKQKTKEKNRERVVIPTGPLGFGDNVDE
jgi:hypothetical protein